ncbi:hypothetical protein [Micromonospora echinospora]|nr:hypothetical protein [Micromonospora echinospora]
MLTGRPASIELYWQAYRIHAEVADTDHRTLTTVAGTDHRAPTIAP